MMQAEHNKTKTSKDANLYAQTVKQTSHATPTVAQNRRQTGATHF